MNNQKVVAVLQECKQMLDDLASEVSEPSEQEKNDYQRCGASLPDDLRTLIQEAKEMKWPFVPERWQYKQTVGPEDKTNLQDLINPRLHELLMFLKTCIKVHDSVTAAAIVFLIDRFLYWADASTRLLSVAKALHKLWPSTPIAPQVVIRQARISVNTGKLLKAEYILSRLISNNGATGAWRYSEESDRLLVQSVCIQIRGQILQKLGMWYEAAELIWTSIVGFFELPVPDKKGIAASLGVLADIFISMSEEDYHRFKKNNNVGLTLLEEFDHRLLSAAEACKLAATFSLYTPLFVLTNLNIRGACLLSYSLSTVCPVEKKTYYLMEAKESFEIGLLTKKRGDQVTSKQELHSFVKSTFCLTNVHKWLTSEGEQNEIVNQLCKEAMEKLAIYNITSDKHDKGVLARDVMCLVTTIKESLLVQPFSNSDDQSFVPDSYKDCIKKNIVIGKVRFSKLLDMYSQHHISVGKVFDVGFRNHNTEDNGMRSGACITALKTTDTMSTVDSSPNQTASSQLNDHAERRKKLVHSDAVSYSFDEKRRQRLSSSQSGSQESSFSNSFNWECIPEQNENDPSEADRIVSLSSSSSSNNILGKKNYSPDINMQGLDLQDNITDHKKVFVDNKTGVEETSNQTSHTGNITAGNTYSETSAANSIVCKKTSEKMSNTYSDDGSFEFLEMSDVDQTNKPSNDMENGIHADQAYGTTNSNMCFQMDLEGETQVTTNDAPPGIQNTQMVPTGPSGVIKGSGMYSAIDLEGETQVTTNDAPPEIQNIQMVPTGPSGVIKGPGMYSAIDLEGETQVTTNDAPTGIQNIQMVPTDPSGVSKGSGMYSGIDLEGETQDETDNVPPENQNIIVPLVPSVDLKHETQDITLGIQKAMAVSSGPSDTKSSVTDARQMLFYKNYLKDKTNEVPGHVTGHRFISEIDLEGETNMSTDEGSVGVPNSDFLPPGQPAISSKSLASSDGKVLVTEDNLEMQFLSRQWSVENPTDKTSLSKQNSVISPLTSPEAKAISKQCQMKEDMDSKLNVSLNSSNGSGSWSVISPSRSLSKSQSDLDSSLSSFIILQAQRKEQILQTRSLDVADYKRLLSGVSHEWLSKRMEDAGVFTFNHVRKTYNALLLKFSKKSELWTAHETLVHFGKDSRKEGKQRKAFWISFLHQDETLGRYFGKAYKDNKELLYHFNDVERQMTAQYYVTEFNKRLYEQNILTQIFYIPASVLLIMDGRTITNCVSVEPYILGDFVKLTNNTRTVRMQYKATKYGLAFGHFVYEFSKFSDIVVDLQGWVTGNKEEDALIYLTDPQIHSVNSTPGASCINFGYKGIYMFFSSQHTECNEICHTLALTRPDIKQLEENAKKRTRSNHQH